MKQSAIKKKKWKKPLIILLLGNGLLAGCILTGTISIKDQEIESLVRNSYEEMPKNEDVSLKLENGEEIPMELQINERIYTEKEVEEFFQSVREELPKAILGENESLDEVWDDLSFVSQLDNNPVSITWQTSDMRFITPMGERTGEELEAGQKQRLIITAYLSCQEQEDIVEIPVTLVKKEQNEKEAFLEKVQKKIEKEQESSQTEAEFPLPKEIDGVALTWIKKNKVSLGGLVFLIFLAAGLVYWKEEKDLEKEMEKRRKQMMLDYPEVVSKITLLLGAGISLQRAWEKMVKEYLEKKERKKAGQRFVYEEMVISYREIENGISLKAALDRFGKRIGLPKYLRFSTLLVQNLQRGNRGLIESLQKEAEEAFEERKVTARKLGEEASTKLLIPMFLMLTMVLVVIMVPAFLSFSL